MDNDFKPLNEWYLGQVFPSGEWSQETLMQCRQIAWSYATAENAIVSMGDNIRGCSYCYFGALADVLGLSQDERLPEIPSLYEEFIFKRAGVEDLAHRHAHELAYIRKTESLAGPQRKDIYLSDYLRLKGADGLWHWINHRMYALAWTTNGSYWLNMCVYTLSDNGTGNAKLVNTRTGECSVLTSKDYQAILSERETNVLLLISEGILSKEIAGRLNISKNTVDRHRQRILEKLGVDNAIEACRVARAMGLLP